ncbi:hypothetical protein ABHV46_07350 [Asaia sp. BMEF1]|uniref:hypothetical protein n=1 Tax=Asaia sp. BMEF1 TaxID=3155932 RepID=UPI003F669513
MTDSDMSALIALFFLAFFLLCLLVEGARHYLRCRDLRAQIRILDSIRTSDAPCRPIESVKNAHEE